jgi:hypothetical protein
MKYIHDGQDYVAWPAGTGMAHSNVARRTGMGVKHAGHLHFLGQPGKVKVHGESTSLRLFSQSFDFPKENWAVALSGRDSDLVISSNKELLEKLRGPGDTVQKAKWLSLPETKDSAPVAYPACPGVKNPLCEYLVNMS